MTGNWRRLLAICGGGLSAVVVLGSTLVFASSGGGPTATSILGSGSDTTQILMMHMDGMYMVSEGCLKLRPTATLLDFSCVSPDPASTIISENYAHDQVHEADWLGSSVGIAQLCGQGDAGVAYIDFARSSRASKSSDCTGLSFVAYARDGISMEAYDDGTSASSIHGMNNTNTYNAIQPCLNLGYCLAQQDIQAIYKTCTFTNWNQVGGANATIDIYTPQSGSGTRSAFEGFVGTTDSSTCIKSAGQSATHYTGAENQNTQIVIDGTQQTFIFPFSFALFSTEVNGIQAHYVLSLIDGIAPSSATIANGTFPYNRLVYNVYCHSTAAGTCGDPASGRHAATQQTVDYLSEEGWICKPSVVAQPGWSGTNAPGHPAVSVNASHPHVLSPHYQANWRALIANKIAQIGFGALPSGAIGGTDLKSDFCRLSNT